MRLTIFASFLLAAMYIILILRLLNIVSGNLSEMMIAVIMGSVAFCITFYFQWDTRAMRRRK